MLEWIFKVKQFLDYYSTSNVDRLTIVAIHFDKVVVQSYQMMQMTNAFHSWNA